MHRPLAICRGPVIVRPPAKEGLAILTSILTHIISSPRVDSYLSGLTVTSGLRLTLFILGLQGKYRRHTLRLEGPDLYTIITALEATGDYSLSYKLREKSGFQGAAQEDKRQARGRAALFLDLEDLELITASQRD